MLALARCYEKGIGTQRSPQDAYALYRKAAKNGDEDGFYHMGRCLLHGIGTARDPDNAVAALKRAAHDGSLCALVLLSDCHRTGVGVPQSALLCRSFLEKAADGQLRAPKTQSQKLETVTFYEHPDKPAIAQALFRLGQFHAIGMAHKHDYTLALAYYGRAIIEGSREAVDEIARIHAYGKSIQEYYSNMPSGSTLTASETRRMEAINYMGDLWFFGQELPKDVNRAVACFRIAAKGGNVAANYSLGWCEKHGKGTPKDAQSAVAHLTFAADAGHTHACFSLAECYETGDGVKRDMRTASSLYKKAAAKGHAGAIKKLTELEE